MLCDCSIVLLIIIIMGYILLQENLGLCIKLT